jgi:hypothetical protein
MSRSSTARAGGRSKGLILTGMIFAVAMTFIDQARSLSAANKLSQPGFRPI